MSWTETHRPTALADSILSPEMEACVQSLIKMDTIKLLFHGPPGTGKTTMANVIIAERCRLRGETTQGNVLSLNASDERGIETVRERISRFLGAEGIIAQGERYLVLDEVDYMTLPAQDVLKRCIENYSTANIILICNYVSRLQPPMRSFFAPISFPRLHDDVIKGALRSIAGTENLRLSEKAYADICFLANGDMRRSINLLQNGGSGTVEMRPFSLLRKLAGKEKLLEAKIIENYGMVGDEIAIARDFINGLLSCAPSLIESSGFLRVARLVARLDRPTPWVLRYVCNELSKLPEAYGAAECAQGGANRTCSEERTCPD